MILHSMPDIGPGVRPSELLRAVEDARRRLGPLLTGSETDSSSSEGKGCGRTKALRVEDSAHDAFVSTNPDGEGTYGGMAIDIDLDAGEYGDRPGRHPHIRIRMEGMVGRDDIPDEAEAVLRTLDAVTGSLAATADDGEEDPATRALLDDQNMAVSMAIEDACSRTAWDEDCPIVTMRAPSPCYGHEATIDFHENDGVNILSPAHVAAWSGIGVVSVCISVEMARGNRPAHYVVVLSSGTMGVSTDDLDPVERMRIMNAIPHVDEPLRIPTTMLRTRRIAA